MQPLAHGYTNDTRSDGSTVVKRYQGPFWQARRSTERHMMSRVAGVVPVPRLIGETVGTLRMEYVAGTHGQELISSGQTAAVLRSCGQMLRRIQAIDVASVFPDVPQVNESVVVHGDYGPNNMLFEPTTFAVTAVLDWEWGHVGDPVEDVAWCEWIVRMHHPEAVDALEYLFAGYGSQPPWTARQAAALAKCHSMLELSHTTGASESGLSLWRRRISTSQPPGQSDLRAPIGPAASAAARTTAAHCSRNVSGR